MAIKKGAFELYTQERKLPEKGQSTQTKKSHFFDDSYTQSNGSQTVHSHSEIKTFKSEVNEKGADNKIQSEVFNGSQLVHSQSSINISKDNTRNDGEIEHDGSKKVHKWFTNTADNYQETIDKDLESGNDNDSQTVHKRFVNNEVQIKTDEDKDNILSEDIVENKLITFSRLVGIQREIIIALYKNMRMNKSDTTEALNLEMISELSGVNQKSLKNTLFRLVNAGCISRAEQKIGRGGWVKYKISVHIIVEIQQTDFLLR